MLFNLFVSIMTIFYFIMVSVLSNRGFNICSIPSSFMAINSYVPSFWYTKEIH